MKSQILRHNMTLRQFVLAAVAALILTLSLASNAEVRPLLITQEIDQSSLVTLTGNTHPEANAVNDRGRVADDFPMSHMMLLLRRPPQTEAAFEQFLAELRNPASPNFRRWLTAAQLGGRFGQAPQDIGRITAWLQSQGFTVNTVYDNGILIDFSGTAGQVAEAFHTEIHHLDVKGKEHVANMSDPQIPEALAPAVVGIVSLNDFMPHPMSVQRSARVDAGAQGVSGDYTTGSGYSVVPEDIATIYNFTQAFNAGYTGKGRTIVTIQDTDVYNYPGDWTTFRKTFGLTKYGATFRQVHPGPGCIPPGINGNDGEAALDVEWATAAAPGAHIVLASCSDVLMFGGFLAVQNILQQSPLPDVVSISYGLPETEIGAALNAYISALYASANAEGVSVYVAAGDSGAAGADNHQPWSELGINVNGFASTPYNVAVGGTDFEDSYLKSNSTYWSSTNDSYYGSAKSYIPEIPWNSSCGSALIASYLGTTPLALCNSGKFLDTAAGGGGPSACATGAPSLAGVVSGTCAGTPKPYGQNLVFGDPNDGVRDLPDVSLFAANGVWGHYYIFCFSDPNNGGTPCTGAPSSWSGEGGTSFAAPIWAGIQALANQKINSLSGDARSTLYYLAAQEYGSAGSSPCNSSRTGGPASSCIFYDVTQGDMDLPCQADARNGSLHNCYLPSGDTYGLLSTSNNLLLPAYGTKVGWDFATGIGTVNVMNLVNAWPPPSNGCWIGPGGQIICD